MLTPNMNLTLPVPTTTLGPQWAQQLNSALEVVDLHDHTSTKGVRVPSAGLNINATLSFQDNAQANVLETRYTNNAATSTNNNSLRVVTGNLYYRDGNGNNIQLTAGGTINAAALGAIGGDYNISTALAAYFNATQSFVFTRATNQAAAFDHGPLTIRDTATSALGITLRSPVGLASSFNLTLPTALPADSSLLMVTSGGAIYTSLSDNSTLEIAAGVLRIKDGGVTNAKLAPTNIAFGTLLGTVVTNTSFENMSGASATITTVGRRVRITFLWDASGGGNAGIVSSATGAVTSWNLILRVTRAGGTVNVGQLAVGGANPATTTGTRSVNYPPSAFVWEDVPPAGTHTYQVSWRVGGASMSGSITDCRLVVEEI